jgi:glycosyltransferase involved in cell wall biosynthesis
MRFVLGALTNKRKLEEPQVIHIVTGEYPPLQGGVGGYTAQLANALVEHGEAVHVWTGGEEGDAEEEGVAVHRIAGRFHPRDLARLGCRMDSVPAAGQRRILVQWTPHSYGMRSLNLAFPIWLWQRAATTADRIEVMVHEAFIAFGEGNWRRHAAAGIQRAMAACLLRAACKVWVTIPKWEERLRPWAFGNPIPFEWLPVPSNIPSVADVGEIVEIRREFTQFRRALIGHFGTFRDDVQALLVPALLELEESRSAFLFVGRGSLEARRRIITHDPEWTERIFATGELDSDGIAANLSACDVLLQPYPDGISTRRGSAMAALSLGVPVVTNLGPLSEKFWSASGAVAWARSSSAVDLADATRELIADHPRRIQMSAKGRDLYQDRFHIRHTVAALLPEPRANALTVGAR